MTASALNLARYVLLPELKLLDAQPWNGFVVCEHRFIPQPCPRCSVIANRGYDRRKVTLKDVPYSYEPGSGPIYLILLKRRLWCVPCRKPFLESIPGCLSRRRTTERFRKTVMWACERFSSMKAVCEEYRISSDFAYRAFYEQLELRRRKNNQYPWPEKIGLDEHCSGKRPDTRGPMFVTMIVNHSRKKLMEVVPGKSTVDLLARVAHIPGRENVRQVTLDMADTYRSFAKQLFPNAQLIADKFHVLRLLSPVILKERKRITGTNANRRARSLLLCNSKKLDYFDRLALLRYLEKYPRLKELYDWKEKLHELYRIKGYFRARDALDGLLIEAQFASEPETRKLGRTLANWREEILNYFTFHITNARVEGFNNKASLVRKQAYGYRNINNYRLRILSVCS